MIAFLKYNVTPARIFMGDTGSLLVGLICAILALKFIELHRGMDQSPYAVQAVPAVAIGILILPLFDTLRVFLTRIFEGRSPLSADRNHIHHLLIDCGFSHMQATTTLLLVNVIFILLVFRFQHLGTYKLLIIILILASSLTALLVISRKRIKLRQRSEKV